MDPCLCHGICCGHPALFGCHTGIGRVLYLGLYWAGVLSTLAMGFGVFLTIAGIAALAVFAKGVRLNCRG